MALAIPKIESQNHLITDLAKELFKDVFNAKPNAYLPGSVKQSSEDILNTKDILQRVKEMQHQVNIFILTLPLRLKFLLENDIENLRLYQDELFPSLKGQDIVDVVKLTVNAINTKILQDKHLKMLAMIELAQNTLNEANQNLQNIALSNYFSLLNKLILIEFKAAFFYAETNTICIESINTSISSILERIDISDKARQDLSQIQDSINSPEYQQIARRIDEIGKLSEKHFDSGNYAELPKLKDEIEQLQQRQSVYMDRFKEQLRLIKEENPNLEEDLEKVEKLIADAEKKNKSKKKETDHELLKIKKEIKQCTSPKEFLDNLMKMNTMLQACSESMNPDEKAKVELLTNNITDISSDIEDLGLNESHIEQCSRCLGDFCNDPLIQKIIENNDYISPLISEIIEIKNTILTLDPHAVQATPPLYATPISHAETTQQAIPISPAEAIEQSIPIATAQHIPIAPAEPIKHTKATEQIEFFSKLKSQLKTIKSSKDIQINHVEKTRQQLYISPEALTLIERLSSKVDKIKTSEDNKGSVVLLKNYLNSVIDATTKNSQDDTPEIISKINKLMENTIDKVDSKPFKIVTKEWNKISSELEVEQEENTNKEELYITPTNRPNF